MMRMVCGDATNHGDYIADDVTTIQNEEGTNGQCEDFEATHLKTHDRMFCLMRVHNLPSSKVYTDKVQKTAGRGTYSAHSETPRQLRSRNDKVVDLATQPPTARPV